MIQAIFNLPASMIGIRGRVRRARGGSVALDAGGVPFPIGGLCRQHKLSRDGIPDSGNTNEEVRADMSPE